MWDHSSPRRHSNHRRLNHPVVNFFDSASVVVRVDGRICVPVALESGEEQHRWRCFFVCVQASTYFFFARSLSLAVARSLARCSGSLPQKIKMRGCVGFEAESNVRWYRWSRRFLFGGLRRLRSAAVGATIQKTPKNPVNIQPLVFVSTEFRNRIWIGDPDWDPLT